MLCAHANEVPIVCPCDWDCYCKSRTCKPRRPCNDECCEECNGY